MAELLEFRSPESETEERMEDLQLKLRIAHMAHLAIRFSEHDSDTDRCTAAQTEQVLLEADLAARDILFYDEDYMRKRGAELAGKYDTHKVMPPRRKKK